MKIWSSSSDWDLVLPPSRPNEYQLNIIRKIVSEHKSVDLKVAILGCTPEFRDLLCEMGVKHIYLFDKSVEFYQKMSTYRIFDNTEIFIQGNWLDTLPNFSSFFDIVLSDLTAGNIDYSNKKRFYELIENSLKPHGVFVDKNLTNENGLITISDITHKYKQLPVNLSTANDFSCEAIFCSELQTNLEIIDTTKIYRILEDVFVSFPRLLRFVELAHSVTPEDCIWYYGKTDVDYIKNLSLKAKHPMINTVYHNHAWVFIWEKV